MSEQKKKRNTFFTIFALAALFVAGYLIYNNYFADSSPATDDLNLQSTTGPLNSVSVPDRIHSPKLDTDVLTDPRFSDLVIFGDSPLEIGEVGRENPFVPFGGFEAGNDEGGEGGEEEVKE